jgi:hypothetical protein
MNQDDFFPLNAPTVKGWCKCGQECDCVIKVFSNGTKHAWATCPACGKTNAKNQRLAPNLEELNHRLLWIRSMILGMPKGIDREEAVAMLERLSDDLGREL